MIQRRSARFVLLRYHQMSSVGNMLQDLGWETLKVGRAKTCVTLLYKAVNGLVSTHWDSYLTPTTKKTHHNHANSFCEIKTISSHFTQGPPCGTACHHRLERHYHWRDGPWGMSYYRFTLFDPSRNYMILTHVIGNRLNITNHQCSHKTMYAQISILRLKIMYFCNKIYS